MSDLNLPADLQDAADGAGPRYQGVHGGSQFIKGARWLYNELLKRGARALDEGPVREKFAHTTDYYDYFVKGAELQHSQDAAQIAALKAEIEHLEKEQHITRVIGENALAKHYRNALIKILDAGNLATQGKWDATNEMKNIAYEAASK